MAVVGVAANVTDDGHQGVLPCSYSHRNKIIGETIIRSNAIKISDILMDVQLDGCTADGWDEFMNKWNKRQTVREKEKQWERERGRERQRERDKETERHGWPPPSSTRVLDAFEGVSTAAARADPSARAWEQWKEKERNTWQLSVSDKIG